MQKVVGSSPISRFGTTCKSATFVSKYTAGTAPVSDTQRTLSAKKSDALTQCRPETRLWTGWPAAPTTQKRKPGVALATDCQKTVAECEYPRTATDRRYG
jgi:hypothetical protein